MHWVYALASEADGSIYAGMTNELERRLAQHQHGYVRSTRNKLPVRVFYCRECETRKQARRLEIYLKSGDGRRFLKSILGDSG